MVFTRIPPAMRSWESLRKRRSLPLSPESPANSRIVIERMTKPPVLAILFACLIAAQTPSSQPGDTQRAPVVVSPEVLPDGRVIVRLYGREATIGPLDADAYHPLVSAGRSEAETRSEDDLVQHRLRGQPPYHQQGKRRDAEPARI